MIDECYQERIDTNAIRCNNKYNNRIVRKQLIELHQKIREVESIGELKKNNYYININRTRKQQISNNKIKEPSKDTDYLTYSEEELMTEVGLIEKGGNMNATQQVTLKKKDRLLHQDITCETIETK